MVFAKTSTTVKSGWIPYTYTFSHGSDNYTVRSFNVNLDDETKGSIIIKKNSNLLTQIPFGQCKETDDFYYCFQNRTFNNSLVDIGPKGEIEPSLEIKLIEYSYAEALTLSRSFEKTSVHVNEVIPVTITLTNNGDFVIKNISLVEEVPDDLEIVSFDSSFSRVGNTLTDFLNLYPGKTWSAEYALKSVKYNNSPYYSTKITYLPENKNVLQSKSSTAISLTTIQPYSVSVSLNKNSFDLNQKIIFKVVIKNNEDSSITIKDFSLKYPSNLRSIYKKNLDQKSNFLLIDDESILEAGKSKEYYVEGIIPFAGSYDFTYFGSIFSKGFSFDVSGSKSFDVVTDGISCSILADESFVDSNNFFDYDLLLNNNANDMFYEIQGDLFIDSN
jgi:hypothetical protein